MSSLLNTVIKCLSIECGYKMSLGCAPVLVRDRRLTPGLRYPKVLHINQRRLLSPKSGRTHRSESATRFRLPRDQGTQLSGNISELFCTRQQRDNMSASQGTSWRSRSSSRSPLLSQDTSSAPAPLSSRDESPKLE